MAEVEIEIPEEVLRRLEALPPGGNYKPGHDWKPWEDEVLRQFWTIKRQRDVADLLKLNISTCRDRYRKLTEAENGRED